MSIFDIYDKLVFGSFRHDNCDGPHPWKRRIWSKTAYPGYKFGSKKCLMQSTSKNIDDQELRGKLALIISLIESDLHTWQARIQEIIVNITQSTDNK